MEEIHQSQVSLNLRKKLKDKDSTVDKAQEIALDLEAEKTLEDEEQVLQAAAIRHHGLNKSVVEAISGFIQKLLEISNINSRKSGAISQGWVDT